MKFAVVFVSLTMALAGQSGALSVSEIRELVSHRKYVQLRERAEHELRVEARSAEGWYALGLALLEGEGVLPRAHFCLSKARTLLEDQLRDADREVLYGWTLNALAETAQLMDRPAEQAAMYELHDGLFEPQHLADIGWPLMKLGRVDEARRRMLVLVGSDSESEASVAMNTLGAIESEHGAYELGYHWFQRSLRKQPGIAASCNVAEVAMILFRFDEAERALLAAADEEKQSLANPWILLTQLYTLQGRLPEALSAAREMMAHNAGNPWVAEQKGAECSRAAAQLMLAAGRDAEALHLTGLLLDRPERHGSDSGQKYRSEVALLGVRHEALRMHRERLGEAAASAGAWKRLGLLGQRISISFSMWRLRRRSAALLAANCGLAPSIVPYGFDSPLPPWLDPPAGESFGWSTELGLLRHCRRGAQQPYQLLRSGELKLSRDDAAGALADLAQAADSLPASEVLLRARLDALQARALEMTGRPTAAAAHYQAALEKDARVFRALSYALPVTTIVEGGTQAGAVAGMIRRSPRFRPGRLFCLYVSAEGDVLTARLESSSGPEPCWPECDPLAAPTVSAAICTKQCLRQRWISRKPIGDPWTARICRLQPARRTSGLSGISLAPRDFVSGHEMTANRPPRKDTVAGALSESDMAHTTEQLDMEAPRLSASSQRPAAAALKRMVALEYAQQRAWRAGRNAQEKLAERFGEWIASEMIPR